MNYPKIFKRIKNKIRTVQRDNKELKAVNLRQLLIIRELLDDSTAYIKAYGFLKGKDRKKAIKRMKQLKYLAGK